MTASVISARGLGRDFGRKRVLRGLELELPEAGFALVTGPNGSGKSTLLSLLAGLLVPTAGELEVRAERGEIGFLAHESLLYLELTALENLDLYGRLYRVPERGERIGMLLERYQLWEARHQRVASFSRGMTQRLALCRTFLHDPPLVLLDEPHSSLDRDASKLVDELLAESAGERTVVLATHEPERVRPLATHEVELA